MKIELDLNYKAGIYRGTVKLSNGMTLVGHGANLQGCLTELGGALDRAGYRESIKAEGPVTWLAEATEFLRELETDASLDGPVRARAEELIRKLGARS